MKDQGLPASRVLDDLHEFYLRRHEGEGTLFEVWEKGAARGDSVTPSTYSEGYRSWMKELLRAALSRNDSKSLLSIGAGNAVIEGEMAEEGYDLLAVDVIEQAVELARSRGLRAECADVSTWTPAEPWPVVYADGVLGHLYKARSRSLPILGRIRSWLPSEGGTLVASNDATRDGSDVERAPGVARFHWLSPAFLREQAVAAGFREVTCRTFDYTRPLSGRRTRSVLIAHA
jgi:Methyltransferase domain